MGFICSMEAEEVLGSANDGNRTDETARGRILLDFRKFRP